MGYAWFTAENQAKRHAYPICNLQMNAARCVNAPDGLGGWGLQFTERIKLAQNQGQ